MATINYASREICCKIVYYGAGFCGKTVSLNYIYKSVPAQYRGELISLATEQDRTLFFDFLALELGSVGGFDTKFQLYTVPGQVFYDATRKLVLRGVDGIVFVVDSQRTRLDENLRSFENLKQNLAEYGYDLAQIPWVIQYNKRDLPDIVSVKELEAEINQDKVASFESVAITGEGVREALKAVAGMVLKRIGSIAQVPQESMAQRDRVAVEAAGRGGTQREAVGGATGRVAAAEQGQVSKARFVAPKRLSPLDPPRRLGSFSVRQKCDLRWGGIRVGSASLEFSDRSNIDGKGSYQLSGTLKIFGLLRRYWLKLLAYRGEEKFTSQDGEEVYFAFSVEMAEEKPDRTPIALWMKNSRERTFHARCGVMGRALLISPEGKRHILKQQ
jgi:signal recognition particle receptor subunit beta